MSKLTQIINILSPKDIKTFRELISTSFFGGKSKHIEMFDLIIKSRTIIKPSVEDRLVQSDLYKMVEKYLVMIQVSSDETYTAKNLLEIFRIKENQKLFDTYLNKMFEIYNKTQDADLGSLLAYEKWKFDLLKSRFTNVDTNTILEINDKSTILQKLKLSINLASQSTLITKEKDIGLLPYILKYIEDSQLYNIEEIGLYYYCWQMMNFTMDHSWFEKFDTLFRKLADRLPEEDKTMLYFQGINFCIRRYNHGEKSYGHQLMNYYIEGLDKGYLLMNGLLSRNTYRNICTVAIRLQRLEDAKSISNDYKYLLRNDDRESAFHFNQASIAFAENKYDAALIFLQKVNFEDHLSNLFAKTLLLKIYFESGEHRLLDSHLDAMQVYLLRQKIVGYHKTNYDKIIKYTKKIVKLSPYDKDGKSKLYNEITNETSIPDKEWLLQKLAAI